MVRRCPYTWQGKEANSLFPKKKKEAADSINRVASEIFRDLRAMRARAVH
jgi:hypothetical protein